MFLLFLAGSIVVQVSAWRRLTRRISTKDLTKIQAVTRYCGWAFLPLLLLMALFLAAVGLEELSELALIEERAAIWAIPIVGMAAFSSIAFAIRVFAVRKHRPFPERT